MVENVVIVGDSGKDTLDKLIDFLQLEARETFGGGDCHIMIANNKLELVDDYGNIEYIIEF